MDTATDRDELAHHYLDTVKAQLTTTKALADRAVAQLSDEDLHREPAPGSNSVAITMNHIAGNLRSRFTDFLTSDGEKTWRDREREFSADTRSRAQIIDAWEGSWAVLFDALDDLEPAHLTQNVMIRSRRQSVLSAIERQVSHYGYHIGQIVYLARLWRGDRWQTLSIAPGGSDAYNAELGHG